MPFNPYPNLKELATRTGSPAPSREAVPETTASTAVPPEMLDLQKWFGAVPGPKGESPGAEVAPEMLDTRKLQAGPERTVTPEGEARAERISHLARKEAAERTEVDRDLLGEVGTSLGRGALGIAKLPFQVAKIVGADVLGSETVKKATVPIIESLEETAESPEWKPSKWAGGKPIDLDRLISDPGEVIGQITSQISNPRFWASQLPEGAMSMIPAFVGAWAPRAVAYAGKLGTALKAAQAAGDTAKIAEIGRKLNRLSTIGMFGASMAMEAGQAEEKVREYELRHPDKPIPWGNRVVSILGTGVVAGGLEALSFGRIFLGKYGGEISLQAMIKQVMDGKGGGLLARKVLDSVATEGVTEGAQTLVENAFAKHGYDPDQKLTEGIVESVLIGAALGGVGGAFTGLNVRGKAVREAAARVLETKRLAEEEYQHDLQGTLQAAEEAAARGEAIRQMRPPEEVEVPSPYTTRDLRGRPRAVTELAPGETPLVDEGGQPVRATQEEFELEQALAKQPWERTAEEKLRVDRARGTLREEAPAPGVIYGPGGEAVSTRKPLPRAFGGPRPQAPAPMGISGAETMEAGAKPKEANLGQRVSQLAARVEETGDPVAAQELNQLLIANQKEVGDLFRQPAREIPGLEPLAGRLETLIRQVEETGDAGAAKELHGLLAANREILSGVKRWEIADRAALPTAPMGVAGAEVEARAVVPETPPTVPPPEPVTPVSPAVPSKEEILEAFKAGDVDTINAALLQEGMMKGTLQGANYQAPRMPKALAEEITAKATELGLERKGGIEYPDGTVSPVFGLKKPLEAPPTTPVPARDAFKEAAALGNQAVAKTAEGTKVPTQYAVVSIHDLVTSHDNELTENPEFPQEYQPRKRDRAASKIQVSEIQNKYDPEMLGANPLAADGAPIVGPDMLVESGNGRTIAGRRLYEAGGDRIRDYRDWLLHNAESFGLDKAAIEGVEDPFLVRIRTGEVTPEDRVNLIKEMNVPSVAPMGAVETAAADGKILRDSDLMVLLLSDKDLADTANRNFTRSFLEKIVSPTQRGQYVTKDGSINQAGLTRIRNAIFAAAYGDSASLEKLAEDVKDPARNITTALYQLAPRMARVNLLMEQGYRHDLSISQNLTDAADLLVQVKENTENKSVVLPDGRVLSPMEYFLTQPKLFAYDRLTLDLVKILDNYKRSPKKILAILNDYLDTVEKAGNPKQPDVFGVQIEVPTRDEALELAVRRVEAADAEAKASKKALPKFLTGGPRKGGPAGETAGRTEESPGGEEGPEGPGPPLTPGKPPKYSLKQAAFGLKSQEKPQGKFDKRLKEIQAAYPDVEPEKAAQILRAQPQATNADIALLSRLSPEEIDQISRGNLAATEKEQVIGKATDAGLQKGLPGLGRGGLFGKVAEAPAATQARQALAQDRGLPVENLKYIGTNPSLGLHLFNLEQPGHPQHESTLAWPIEKEAKAPAIAPLTTKEIQKAFGPEAQVTASTLMPHVYEVLLPNGTRILVKQNAEIKVAPEALAQYGKTEIGPEEYIAGEWRSINGINLISLAKGEGATSLNHEVLHAAMELALTKRERAAVLKEHGDEEAAARAYETWNPAEKPDTLFQKILNFFRRIVEVFKPSAAGVFGKVKSGEVWGREVQKSLTEGQKVRVGSSEEIGKNRGRSLNDPDKVIQWAAPKKPDVPRDKQGRQKRGWNEYKDWNVFLGEIHPRDISTDVALTENAIKYWRENKSELGMVNLRGLNEEDIVSILSAAKRDEVSVTVNRWGDFAAYKIKTGLNLPNVLAPPKYSIRSVEAETRLQAYQEKMMAPEGQEPSGWQKVKDTVFLRGDTKQEATDTFKGWYDEIVDRYAPFERAQARAVKGGGLIPAGETPTYTLAFWRGQEGWTAQAVMKNGVYQETKEGGRFTGDNRKVGESLSKRLDPIRDLAQARGEKPEVVMNDLFNRFMVAQRDLELAGETGIREAGEIKGVNPEESRQVLADLKQVYGKDYAVLERVAGKLEADGNFTPGSIREWSDQAILQRLEQGGLITPELRQEIKAKNQFYLPFRRLMDQVNDYVNAYARALGVKGKVIETIKGSEKQILDPLQMLMDLAAKANYAYARNRIFDSVARLGEFDPEIYEVKGKIVPGIEKAGESPFFGLPTKEKTWAWSQLPPEEGTVPYYRDGKLRWLKLPADMFKATQNMMPEDIGLLLSWAKKPADLLRAGAVTTPEFGLITNPIRDIAQAWVFSRFGFSPFKWFRDLALLISKDAKTVELRNQAEAGGGFMATLAQSFLEPEKITADDITGKKKGMWYAAHPVQALRHVSAYLENLTRFSIYKQAREKGLSHAEAIHEMRRTTLDFRRTGGHPVVRYLNMIVPFFNASIQGTDKLMSELAGPNRNAVLRRLAMLTAGSIGLWLLAHQDDRYKELENWERNYFWHIPLGKNGPMIRLPKPFEAGIMFGSVPERILDQLVDKNVGGVKSALKAAYDALTPEFIPAFARGIIEGRSNYNWFLDRPIEDVALQQLPVELRSKPWTSELAKAVSRYVGPVAKPVMELSPVKVEHLVRTMSGGLGANFFLPGIDVALRKAGILEDIPQPEQDLIQKVWGVRALFTKPPVGYRAKSVGDFFETYQKTVQADQGWKNLWNTGSLDKLDQFLKDNPEAMFARVARKQMAELGKIKKERNAIHLSRTLDSEQKKVKLDALDERIVQLVKAGNVLMDPEVAQAVGMPSRFKRDAFGTQKSMDLDGYYKFVVESLGDAYEGIQKEIPRLLRMDDASRQRFLIKTIRQARAEYQPLLKKPEDVLKPYRFQNLLDKPTRKERATWQSMFGVRKIPPGAASGYRLKEEEKEMRP